MAQTNLRIKPELSPACNIFRSINPAVLGCVVVEYIEISGLYAADLDCLLRKRKSCFKSSVQLTFQRSFMSVATREDLFAMLDEQGIKHETKDHQPVFTVEESAAIKADMPGAHTKNLFLKDKGGNFFLICAESHAQIKVNKLHPHLGCKRLSFANSDYLMEHLGVEPGSVCLFSIMNDTAGEVTLVIDKTLADSDIVNFHPLNNDATTVISSDDMVKFAKATGHAPIIMDFAVLNPDA